MNDTDPFVRQTVDAWVNPELDKRRQAGTIGHDFLLRTALVLFPQGLDPVVKLNEEAGWIAHVQATRPVQKGQDVVLADIRKIVSVEPPVLNGRRVAFVFLRFDGYYVRTVFDFSPNLPDAMRDQLSPSWSVSEALADALNQGLFQHALRAFAPHREQLETIGLWSAPVLMPDPLARIVELVKQGQPEGAIDLLNSHCTTDFWKLRLEQWSSVPAFALRKSLIESVLSAHERGEYCLSISALVPHVEGIITDWLYATLPEGDVRWRQVSKIKKFKDTVAAQILDTYDRQAVVWFVEFILEGPFLADIRWTDAVAGSFVNRNVVGHGRYDPDAYTHGSSTKLLLLVDSLHWCLSAAL